MDHGRTKFRHGLHKICDPNKATAKPVLPLVARPSRRAQIYADFELERLNILREENPLAEDATEEAIAERAELLDNIALADADDQHQQDLEIWRIQAKNRETQYENLAKESLEFFGFMWQHLKTACRLALEEKYGKDHFEGEDPKILADAIREHFIGREKGAEGNLYAVEAARRRYHAITQHFHESVSTFKERCGQELEILIRQEVLSNDVEYPPGTNITDEKFKMFTERMKVQHFIYGLSSVKFEEWKRQMLWEPKMYPMPETMSEAYRQAVNWEEQFKLKQEKEDNPPVKAGVYVSKEAGKKPGYKTTEYDIDGSKICWRWRDSKKCDRGKDCPFSHKPAVGADKTDESAKDQITKAAKEVKFDVGGGPVGQKKA